MDPVTFIGTLSATGAIVAGITKVAHKLSTLRGRFHEADTTLGLLIVELSAVKGALGQVDDWANFGSTNNPVSEDLAEAFELSLEGCRTAVSLLEEEVVTLTNAFLAEDDDFMARARTVWNESTIKDHQQKLHGQILALQLLLQTVQVRSLPGQAALLRQPTNRRIIIQMKDDTSSLRAIARSSRLGAESIMTRTDSEMGDTVFGFDQEMTAYGPYKNNGARAVDKHRENNQRTTKFAPPLEDTAPMSKPRVTSPTITVQPVQDAKPFNTSPTLSRSDSQRWTTPEPYQLSVRSEPVGRRSPTDLSLRTAAYSESALPPAAQFFSRTKSDEDKSGLWATIKRQKSRLSMSNSLRSPRLDSPMSPSASTRRGRRRSENDIHRSVDLGREKLPAIVEAAQNGSGQEIEHYLDQGADIEQPSSMTRRTALAVAAHCGHEDIVEILLQRSARMDTKDVAGQSPLHLAASRGHYKAVELLLSWGAEVDCLTPDLKTPLRLASDNGYHEVTQLLIQRQARINTRDRRHLTPLHAAAKAGDDEMVNLLIENNADLDARDAETMAAIHYAAEGGHVNIIESLLNKKVNIDYTGKESMTPLMFACSAGRIEVVKALIRKKASLKHKSDGEMTALHWASFHGHTDVVELLLQKRAAIDARTSQMRTPLHVAVLSRNFATVEYLLRHEASIESCCSYRGRPLHYACKTGDADIVRLLLSFKADVEAADQAEQRPIHIATAHGFHAVVDMLIAKGASIDCLDRNGERPLCLACMHGHTNIVRTLLGRGSLPRLKFMKGQSYEDSPLCIASKHGHLDVVLELMTRGASVKQLDEKHWQPLRYAAYHGHSDVVEVLLLHGASVSSLFSGTAGSENVAGRIGFANDVTEEQKEQILGLLTSSEAAERSQQQISMWQNISVQAGVVEMDSHSTSTIPHRVTAPLRRPTLRQHSPPRNSTANIGTRPSNISNTFLDPTHEEYAALPDIQSYEDRSTTPIPRRHTTKPRTTVQRVAFTSDLAFDAIPSTSSTISRSVSAAQPWRSNLSPPPPARTPPRPPTYTTPETKISMDGQRPQNLACDNCKISGKCAPDFTCAQCRSNVYKFSHGQAVPVVPNLTAARISGQVHEM